MCGQWEGWSLKCQSILVASCGCWLDYRQEDNKITCDTHTGSCMISINGEQCSSDFNETCYNKLHV